MSYIDGFVIAVPTANKQYGRLGKQLHRLPNIRIKTTPTLGLMKSALFAIAQTYPLLTRTIFARRICGAMIRIEEV